MTSIVTPSRSCNADIAIIFAESGKREEAVAQLEANLKQFPESWLTAMKSGEAFEALGDAAAAEASYRRAMILGEDETDQEEATSMLAELLEDMGRFEERDELLSATIDGEPDGLEELVSLHSASLGGERRVDAKPAPLAAVGRNEPCPCGSGMKYKKCHGA